MPLVNRKSALSLVPALVASLALVTASCSAESEAPSADGTPTTTAPLAPARPASDTVLRVAWGTAPLALDTGAGIDPTSSNVLFNLMDPLVRLGDDLEPVPSAAESWDVSPDLKTVTFHLRRDGKWTNGDPVTARNFVYAWKRLLSPAVASPYAHELWGIAGAFDYSACDPTVRRFSAGRDAGEPCDPAQLRAGVGVRSLDEYTLAVTLASPQPWFVRQVAHHAFLALHQATVERFGDDWEKPENIVTNGPFKLTAWEPGASITLEKNAAWRDADSVRLERIEGTAYPDAASALRAFEHGEIDACLFFSCIPLAETERLARTPEFATYPSLGNYYYGVNLKNVPDLNERRALAFAIDRESIVINITQGGQTPATTLTPPGVAGYDAIRQDFLPASGDLERAREYLAEAQALEEPLTLFFTNAPGHRAIAAAVQSRWNELGVETSLKSLQFQQYLRLLGPPAKPPIDVYQFGWRGDYVDAMTFLELWTCESASNSSSFCNPEFDKLVEQARRTSDDRARYRIYARLEGMLTGPGGALPAIPIYSYTSQTLRRTYVENWAPNPLDQYDFARVFVTS